MKLIIQIPCLNEAETLPGTLLVTYALRPSGVTAMAFARGVATVAGVWGESPPPTGSMS